MVAAAQSSTGNQGADVKPLPISFSTLDKFRNCQKQFYEIKVAKSVVDVQGDAALWGDFVHKQFENYLLAKGLYTLPDSVEMHRRYLDTILSQPGELHVELEMAVNTKLEPCEFFAADVFARGKADVLRINGTMAYILDHKTGKRKRDSDQMRMMALLCFMLFPAVQKIRVGFVWLKDDKTDADNFTREQIPELWNGFLPDITQYRNAFRDDVWQPRQSGLCHGWCPVKTCEFWKPKRVK